MFDAINSTCNTKKFFISEYKLTEVTDLFEIFVETELSTQNTVLIKHHHVA